MAFDSRLSTVIVWFSASTRPHIAPSESPNAEFAKLTFVKWLLLPNAPIRRPFSFSVAFSHCEFPVIEYIALSSPPVSHPSDAAMRRASSDQSIVVRCSSIAPLTTDSMDATRSRSALETRPLLPPGVTPREKDGVRFDERSGEGFAAGRLLLLLLLLLLAAHALCLRVRHCHLLMALSRAVVSQRAEAELDETAIGLHRVEESRNCERRERRALIGDGEFAERALLLFAFQLLEKRVGQLQKPALSQVVPLGSLHFAGSVGGGWRQAPWRANCRGRGRRDLWR